MRSRKRMCQALDRAECLAAKYQNHLSVALIALSLFGALIFGLGR